jgi:hypothetical protein
VLVRRCRYARQAALGPSSVRRTQTSAEAIATGPTLSQAWRGRTGVMLEAAEHRAHAPFDLGIVEGPDHRVALGALSAPDEDLKRLGGLGLAQLLDSLSQLPLRFAVIATRASLSSPRPTPSASSTASSDEAQRRRSVRARRVAGDLEDESEGALRGGRVDEGADRASRSPQARCHQGPVPRKEEGRPVPPRAARSAPTRWSRSEASGPRSRGSPHARPSRQSAPLARASARGPTPGRAGVRACGIGGPDPCVDQASLH